MSVFKEMDLDLWVKLLIKSKSASRIKLRFETILAFNREGKLVAKYSSYKPDSSFIGTHSFEPTTEVKGKALGKAVSALLNSSLSLKEDCD